MTALTIITPADLKSAGSVLETNKSWVTKYTKKFDVLIEKAEKEGVKLSPETDAAINDYLASIKKAAATAEANRKPYTQKLDQVKALFTAEENKLKVDLFTPLQAKRNASATAYAADELIKRKNEQLKLDKEKEKINQFAEGERQLRSYYSDILKTDKEILLKAYEVCTLESIDEVVKFFENIQGELNQEAWDSMDIKLSSRLLTPEELAVITEEAKEGKFDKIAPHYKMEITAYAAHLLTLIPQRRQELAEGKASEAAELLKQQQLEQENNQKEDAEKRAQAELSSKVATAVVDVQIGQANRSVGMPKAQTIDSYEIEVLDRAGWAEIFKFYFTNSGEQDLGKVKMDSMKLFAERYAKSHGVQIESEFIMYNKKYKAVVKTKKAA